jgi:conjugative transfer signal peptidase TraF
MLFRSLVAPFVLVCLAASALLPLRFNLTRSMPLGIYWIVSPGQIERGDLVSSCLPPAWSCFGKARNYLGSGGPCACGARPVIKRVVATQGDRVDLSSAGLRVNGVAFQGQRFPCDRAGRRLPQLHEGTYRVPDSFLWLRGETDPRSWDSRYFGPVPSALTLSRLRPLLVRAPW